MSGAKLEFHPKFKDLYGSKEWRYAIVTGGRSSGKSHAINTWAVMMTFEEGHRILHSRYTAASVKDSIVADVSARIHELGIEHKFTITRDRIVNKDTGSDIMFRGLKAQSGDEKARLKSLSGVTILIIEEAEDMRDEDAFDVVNLSIRGTAKNKKIRTVLLLNPTDVEHFVYRRWFASDYYNVEDNFEGLKKNTLYIKSHWTDIDEHLSDDEREELLRIQRDRPEYYKYAIDGNWLYARDGVVYNANNWRIGPYKETDNCVIGLDFGFTHPTAFVKVSVDNDLMVAWMEELCYEPGMTPEDMHKFILKNKLMGYKFIGDGARPEIIEQLRRKMVQIKAAAKGPGSVLDGINLMQDYQIIVDPNSKNLQKEFKMYVWDDKMQEKPIKEWDDALDAARYAVMALRKKRNIKFIEL